MSRHTKKETSAKVLIAKMSHVPDFLEVVHGIDSRTWVDVAFVGVGWERHVTMAQVHWRLLGRLSQTRGLALESTLHHSGRQRGSVGTLDGSVSTLSGTLRGTLPSTPPKHTVEAAYRKHGRATPR